VENCCIPLLGIHKLELLPSVRWANLLVKKDNTIKLWNLSSGKLLRGLFFWTYETELFLRSWALTDVSHSGSVDVRQSKFGNWAVETVSFRNSDWGNYISSWRANISCWWHWQTLSKSGIWNTGELLHTLSGHSSDITSISFSAIMEKNNLLVAVEIRRLKIYNSQRFRAGVSTGERKPPPYC